MRFHRWGHPVACFRAGIQRAKAWLQKGEYLFVRWQLPALLMLLLIGVGIGALLYQKSNTAAYWLSRFSTEYVIARAKNSFGAVFGLSFRPLRLIYGCLLLNGVSLTGVGTIPPILMFVGLGMGMSLGCFFQQNDRQILLCTLLAMLPYCTCVGALLALQAQEGIRLSAHLLRAVYYQTATECFIFSCFARRSAIVFAGLCICAICNTALTRLLLI